MGSDMVKPSGSSANAKKQLQQDVWNKEYGALAENKAASGGSEECRLMMKQLGYTDEMLESLPEGAIMGIGCGCPTALVDLEPGMNTLDIGCGAGCDTILAGIRVAGSKICPKTGKPEFGVASGIDILPSMIKRATENLDIVQRRTLTPSTCSAWFSTANVNEGGLKNYPAASFDVVTSNCCVCLFDQGVVLPDILRILKPGGNFCFTESMATGALSPVMQRIVDDVYVLGARPEGHSASAKAFRALIGTAHANQMREEEVKRNLEGFGFHNVHTCDVRMHPRGLEAAALSVPKLVGEGIAEDMLADLNTRFLDEWVNNGFNIDDHVVYCGISAKKPAV